MKKGLLIIVILALLLSRTGIAPASSTKATKTPEPEPTLMPSPPPPSVGTTSPGEPDLAGATSQTMPGSYWIQAGPVSFDAGQLTVEERVQLIQQLQMANLRSSLANSTIVAGLETTRDNPCYIGQSARFRQTAYGDQSEEFMVTMSLVDIKRGEAAAAIADKMVMQYYSEGNGLRADMEYAVCTFEISATADNLNQQIQFTSYDFQAISAKGRFINQPMLLANDDCYLTIVPGSSGSLQVVLAVEKGTYPTVLYLKKVWFSMLEPA